MRSSSKRRRRRAGGDGRDVATFTFGSLLHCPLVSRPVPVCLAALVHAVRGALRRTDATHCALARSHPLASRVSRLVCAAAMAISEADWTRQLARSNPAHRLLIARAPALFAEARVRPDLLYDLALGRTPVSVLSPLGGLATHLLDFHCRHDHSLIARYFSRADIWHRLVDRAVVLALAGLNERDKHKRILVVRRRVARDR